jgi:uncharacterized membrane protein YgcG
VRKQVAYVKVRADFVVLLASSAFMSFTPSLPLLDLDSIVIPEEVPGPFPAPSEPLQYRAIGIVHGRYEPSEERITQGTLHTDDGVAIDAVLLGRVLSLVRKHLDLSANHPWVVYPRTREGGGLHTQIVGVWSLNPDGLKAEKEDLSDEEEGEHFEESGEPEKGPLLYSTANLDGVNGFFSVRGEIAFQSQQEGFVLLKIRQQSKKKKPGRAFKLRLEGTLPDNARGQFWDIEVRRDSETLTIQDGTPITTLPKPPATRRPGGGGGFRGGRPSGSSGGSFRGRSEGTGGGGLRPRTEGGGGLVRPARPRPKSEE